jgi:hypothetical protein
LKVTPSPGNSGGRCDVAANGLLQLCHARGWALVAFDCAGSGLSDGDQVYKTVVAVEPRGVLDRADWLVGWLLPGHLGPP